MNTITKSITRPKLITAVACLILGLILPTIFHFYTDGLGQVILPMHFPILLVGMLCGWRLGLVVGAATPILSSLLTNMPPLWPTASSMAFELAAYAVIGALLIRRMNVYGALIGALVGGRIVAALARFALFSAAGQAFTLEGFWRGVIQPSLPGIALQLAFVPVVVILVRRSGLLGEDE
ncbi:MAG: ECF transporter S component [Oscillospiraceae bacterium]|nr:ECF transporter S component [Oscillospiraceae bacterium]